jgi:GntR family transcriptional regulator, arabinose operon transcriptional repressor
MQIPNKGSVQKPRYEIILEYIKEKIYSGEYAVGSRVPSEKELSDQFNVSRITSKKALDLLVSKNMIERIPGRGSYVTFNQEVEDEPLEVDRDGYLLGYIVPEFDESYGYELFLALEQTASKYFTNVIVKPTNGNAQKEKEAIKTLLELGVDGLIILPVSGEYFNEEILKLNINSFPHVLIDRYLTGFDTTSICSDNVQASMAGVNYLFDLNHKNITLFAPPYEDTSAIEDRIDGFIQAYAEKSIKVNKDLWLTNLISTLPINRNDDQPIRRDIDLIKSHLQVHPEISAVFAMEYNIAVLTRIAALELGLSIPEDLSIICFDSPKKAIDRYLFTHIKQNEKSMGEKAVEAVLSLIKKEKYQTKTFLETKLVLGDSTAECKNHITNP